MKRIILVYGAISGAISLIMMFVTVPLVRNGMLKGSGGELVGYTIIVISLSMIFFGVKSYRDNYLSGRIKFWKATQVGVMITLVASLIYAIAWEIDLKLFVPNFIEEYSAQCISRAKEKGATPEELQKIIDRMNSTKEIYKYPVLRFGMTMMEMFPVGLVVALISAGILKKKEILPV